MCIYAYTACNPQTGHTFVIVMQINDYGFYANFLLTKQHELLKHIYLFLNHMPTHSINTFCLRAYITISFNFIKKRDIVYTYKVENPQHRYYVDGWPFGDDDVVRSNTNCSDTNINMDGLMTYLVHNTSLRTRDSYTRTTVRNRLICKCHHVGRGRAVHMRLLRCCVNPAK